MHWLICGMAGRLDAESNDIAAQITDYNSTECEQTALARPDWRGQQNLHASYSFVLPEGSDFEDETRVGQGPTRSPRGDHADFSDRGRDALFFFFSKAQIPNSIRCTSWVPWSTWHTVPSAREMRSESSYSEFQFSSNRSSRLDERVSTFTSNSGLQHVFMIPSSRVEP